MNFMYGRYGAVAGIDSFGFFLFILNLVFSFAGVFFGTVFGSKLIYLILSVLSSVCFWFMIFRFFSRNIYGRSKENSKFKEIWRKVKSFLKLQKDRIKDRKTHVYKKCPKCKAVLRLPKKKGKHSVVCPRCSNRFDVKN